VEEAERNAASGPPAPGALPPEVEAELRRRAQVGSAAAAPAAPAQAALVGVVPMSAEQPPEHTVPRWQERLKLLGPFGIFLIYLFGKLKLLLVFLSQFKFLGLILKFGAVLLKTGGTMLISMAVYATAFGWQFAAGFVLSILVHELGHVYAAWRLGLPISAPIFIPGMGAIILAKRGTKSAWDGAIMGIGGPIGGLLAGLFCLLVYTFTGSKLMLALANTGFFINLFNLAPIYPLDGGWITGAISPRLWLLGIVGMIVGFVTGFVRNPMIFLLVVLSLPRFIHGLKTGDITPPGGVPTTPHQRIVMGIAYVGLCAALAWLMAATELPQTGV
jgi:Zn-dependent protease